MSGFQQGTILAGSSQVLGSMASVAVGYNPAEHRKVELSEGQEPMGRNFLRDSAAYSAMIGLAASAIPATRLFLSIQYPWLYDPTSAVEAGQSLAVTLPAVVGNALLAFNMRLKPIDLPIMAIKLVKRLLPNKQVEV